MHRFAKSLCRALPFVLPFALLPGAAHAEETLKIEPGLWETTTSTESPMFPQPQVRTNESCVTPDQAEFNPQRLVQEAKECSITDQSRDGNKINWSMICKTQMGEATATGSAEVNGNRGNGNMVMNMNLGGTPMSLTTTWESRRVGECG